MAKLFGKQCVEIDVNSMKPLDNLCHPISVIKKAEELAAEAFHAAHAFLMVGGTTSSVQTMVLTACKKGDKIIYKEYSTSEIKMDEKDYVIVKEEDVLAIL